MAASGKKNSKDLSPADDSLSLSKSFISRKDSKTESNPANSSEASQSYLEIFEEYLSSKQSPPSARESILRRDPNQDKFVISTCYAGKLHQKNLAVEKKIAVKKVTFETVAEYVELELLGDEGVKHNHVTSFFIGLEIPVVDVFLNQEEIAMDDVDTKKKAVDYWKYLERKESASRTTIFSSDLTGSRSTLRHLELESDDSGSINLDKVLNNDGNKARAQFIGLLEVIEENWKIAGNCEALEDDVEATCFFFDGDRSLVELENEAYFKKLLAMVPDSKAKEKLNLDQLTEVFVAYASVSYMTEFLADGSLPKMVNLLLTHEHISPENENFEENWDLDGLRAIKRLISLYEAEVDLVAKIEGIENFKRLRGLPVRTVKHFEQRLLVELEDDGDEEFAEIIPRRRRKQRDEGKGFQDLLTGEMYQFMIRSIPIDDPKEGESDMLTSYYCISKGNIVSDPDPLIVPQSWACLKMQLFLSRPVFAWKGAKMAFLRSYYDLLNQFMISACLNSNKKLLVFVRDHETPVAFHDKDVADHTFADTTRAGTAQLAIVKQSKEMGPRGETMSNEKQKRYLMVGPSSFYLKPLVRADLAFSAQPHCQTNQRCTGHSGLLLLYMVSKGDVDFAKILIEGGVKVNSKCCFGNIKSFRWVAERSEPPDGSFIVKKDILPENRNGKLLKNLRGEGGENPVTLDDVMKTYIPDFGVVDDQKPIDLVKLEKITPLSVAVERAIDSGDNSCVKMLLSFGAKVWRVESRALRMCTKIVEKVAFFARKAREEKRTSKSMSLLPKASFIFSFGRKRKQKNKSTNFGSILDTCFSGISIGKSTKQAINKSSDKVLKANLECLELIVKGFVSEMRERLEAAGKIAEEDIINISIRATWLHHALLQEEWEVARFLCEKFCEKRSNVGREVISHVVDMFIVQLAKAHNPFAARALNGLSFLMQDLEIMFSPFQFSNLFNLISQCFMQSDLLKPGILTALRCFFKSKPLLHALHVERNTDLIANTVDLEWDQEQHDNQRESINNIREVLCMQLIILDMVDVVMPLLFDELFQKGEFVLTLLDETTWGGHATAVFPLIVSLVNRYLPESDEQVASILSKSIEDNNVVRCFCEAPGLLNSKTIVDFLQILLLCQSKSDFIDGNELAIDCSQFMSLHSLIEFLNSESMDDSREEVLQKVMSELKNSTRIWVDGLAYLFEHTNAEDEELETFAAEGRLIQFNVNEVAGTVGYFFTNPNLQDEQERQFESFLNTTGSFFSIV